MFSGAQLLGIRIKHVPIDPVTMRVDIKAMKRMITRNTCMVIINYLHSFKMRE
jgi:glutamate/tyrosine decarboxylase-like PLP-dependent enzyme